MDLRAERPGARRIGGTVKTDHGNSKRGSKVQRAGIAANKDAGSARERDELPNGAPQLKCMAAAGLHHCAGQLGFFRRRH